MRDRLSWDEEKVAEITKQADPYTMNQDRKNPPAAKYDIGGPSEFGEDQDKKKRWESEGRTETGHPAPQAREAVIQARKLEDKALKCLTIAQRMLPGADEAAMEDQATDLMFLPERAIMATLSRQTELATVLAGDKEEEKEEEKEEAKEEETPVEAKKEEVKEEAKEEETPVEAKKEEVKEEVKEEAKEEETPVEAKKEEVKEEAKEEAKEEETPVEASQDLLDVLFDGVETPEVKTGAKKLSGLVKKASSSNESLSDLWDTPPDISSVFGKSR